MLRLTFALLALAFVPNTFAADLDKAKLAEIDAAVKDAIRRGEVPGAVVVVLHADKIVYRKAFGNRSVKPEKVAMTTDTVFDLASLTKPIATATSIMILIQQGKLKPDDLVSKHWPEFGNKGKEKITLAHLLLHTSGLTPDNALADYAQGRRKALQRIAALGLRSSPGERFRYSDVGFIVLGELVERVGKMPLDQFAKKHVFDPLKMTDTGFNPNATLRKRIAPTDARKGKIIQGEVHDPRAFAMEGVAGHAGLFSSVDDLTRYCRMLLHKGALNGVRVLDAKTVKLFTEPHSVTSSTRGRNRKGSRSLGWDVNTGYSAPRGELFEKGKGYGHTGFTGTSVWIDPPTGTAILVLANRVHPNGRGNATPLRRRIGTIVAKALGKN